MKKEEAQAPVDDRKHIFMLSAQAYFHLESAPDDVQGVHMNVVMIQAEQKITAPDLGKAQAQVAGQLRARYKDPISVVDVVFNAASYMGHMTPAEWAGTTPEQLAQGMEDAKKVIGEIAAGIKQ
uniref:Uncharacterized protein n=1 Tax=Pseudomonas phage Arace01 TaxID=3138526 RepID=A0AAU6VZA7_9VIRU